MTENKICTKCGIPITSATRFSTDICLTCYAKTFEIEFSQAQREAHLLQTFGENPRSYPPYALVAETYQIILNRTVVAVVK
jgi:ribosomal protein L40E